jgi:hypothetical protein
MKTTKDWFDHRKKVSVWHHDTVSGVANLSVSKVGRGGAWQCLSVSLSCHDLRKHAQNCLELADELEARVTPSAGQGSEGAKQNNESAKGSSAVA